MNIHNSGVNSSKIIKSADWNSYNPLSVLHQKDKIIPKKQKYSLTPQQHPVDTQVQQIVPAQINLNRNQVTKIDKNQPIQVKLVQVIQPSTKNTIQQAKKSVYQVANDSVNQAANKSLCQPPVSKVNQQNNRVNTAILSNRNDTKKTIKTQAVPFNKELPKHTQIAKQFVRPQSTQYDPFTRNNLIPPPQKKVKRQLKVESPVLNTTVAAPLPQDILDQILSSESSVEMYICKRMILAFNKHEIPICLVSEIRPLLEFPNESRVSCKFHPEQQTIDWLIDNPKRSFICGQVQFDFSQMKGTSASISILQELSDVMRSGKQIIGHNYNSQNSKLCILTKSQIQRLLSKRNQKLKAPDTAVVMKQLVEGGPEYLKWWSNNAQYHSHNLFYLIFYKEPSISTVPFEIVNLQNPSIYSLSTIEYQEDQKQSEEFQGLGLGLGLESFLCQNPDFMKMLNTNTVSQQMSDDLSDVTAEEQENQTIVEMMKSMLNDDDLF